MGFLNQPSPDELRYANAERQKKEQELNINYDNLRKSGYTEEQIRRIRKNIDRAKENPLWPPQ